MDDRAPRTRLKIRPEIAKGSRKGDVFLPDALMGKLRKFWAHKARRPVSASASAASSSRFGLGR